MLGPCRTAREIYWFGTVPSGHLNLIFGVGEAVLMMELPRRYATAPQLERALGFPRRRRRALFLEGIFIESSP